MTTDIITLDLVLYQPRFADVRLLPTRVDTPDAVESKLAAIGVQSHRQFLDRIASRYAAEKRTVPMEDVPPPRLADGKHVYKIGEIDVDASHEVVDERFGDEYRDYHIVGKDNANGGEHPQPTHHIDG